MVFEGDSIIDRLRQTECPAFWKLECLENKAVCMYDKLSEKNEEIAGQLWRHIVLEIAISYEYITQAVPLTSEASQKLHYCLAWINNSDDNSFVKKYETAFKHLVQSFRAFVALKKQAHSEAVRCFKEIVAVTEMSKSDLAAVYGIKGNVMAEYGIGGTKEAFTLAREAIRLDDTEPEWHFLLGKLHARWRHFSLLREPPEEEVSSLEKAYELFKAAHTAVYLAANCSERAKFLHHKQPLERGKRIYGPQVELAVRNFNRRAMQLYNEAMEMNQDRCVHIMTRCARGFAQLPAEFRNIETALKLAQKALKKAPGNAMLLATLSLIWNCKGDIGGAVINAKRSANAGAFGSHIRLMNLYQDYKKKTGPDKYEEVDIAVMIDQTLKEFPVDVYRLQLFIYGASYFLFVKRDLFRSLPYFENALELDSRFNLLKDRYVRWVKVYLNLYELMFNEIECAILKESFAVENEKQMLLRVREKIIAAWPEVVNLKIERDLVYKLRENRFPSNRGRARTRKNVKKDPKNRKTGKKDSKKRLKSAMSLSAHSKDTYNQKIRSSSDDRAFHLRPNVENDFQKNLKRPHSHDGRSQSREDTRKKFQMEKMVDRLKNSLSDLTIDELKPEHLTAPWGCGAQNNLEASLSQLSLGPETKQRGKPNSFSKRSVSFERQSLPQKRTAVKTLDGKNIDCLLPNFAKTPSAKSENSGVSSTMQYFSLTVANVEKLGNARINDSKESLDSDDTHSHLSELSLQKSTEQSVSSISMTTKRSLSLDSSRCPVQDAGAKKSESWVDLCENDPYITASGIDEDPLPKGDPRATPSTSRLVNKNERIGSGSRSRSGAWNQEQIITERMRELSLEKKQRAFQSAGTSSRDKSSRQSVEWSSGTMSTLGRPLSTGQSSHFDSRTSYGRHSSSDRSFDTKVSHRPPTERSTYHDRRSPFGRQPSAENRVLRPPGFRSQRSDSESSVSSVGSDYVASPFSRRGYRKYPS